MSFVVPPCAGTGTRHTCIWVCLAAAGVCCQNAFAGTATTRVCGPPGYSYAGLQDARVAHGIRATLVALARPRVEDGHVAAWVGVGGPGQGLGGGDAWIQIGLSAFSDGINHLYFESDRPGRGPRYTQLVPNVPAGARNRVAVLEIPSRPEWWQVWLNGAPASTPVHLIGSGGRWRPIVTAESWVGGERVCNRFAYGFEHVEVAAARRGGWTPLVTGSRFQDPGYQMFRKSQRAFLARAVVQPG